MITASRICATVRPRVFPNCTAKPKGERTVYVGDALLDAKDIMSLTMRRPFDRVRMGVEQRQAADLTARSAYAIAARSRT